MAVIKGLTCFKCNNNTAMLTYEENRVYKVACPCGCEYTFNHCSMSDAEAYHLKMVELYGEIDRNKVLKTENAMLRKMQPVVLDGEETEWFVLAEDNSRLEQENAALREQLARATADRDAAIDEIYYMGKRFNDCSTCSGNRTPKCSERREMLKEAPSISCWNWRGKEKNRNDD